MGKIWVVLVGFILLASCASSTVDMATRKNIEKRYIINGIQHVSYLSPSDVLKNERKTIFGNKDSAKTEDETILEIDENTKIVKKGSTGETELQNLDGNGKVTSESLNAMQNNAGLDSAIVANKHPIQYQDFGQNHIWSGHELDNTHPGNYKFKLVNGKIPQLPSDLGKKYAVVDPFFITFDSLDEGWSIFNKMTDGRVITYGREIQDAFFSNKYQVNFAYSKDDDKPTLYRYDNVEVEPNSYWVEKKVGSFKPLYYKTQPCKEIPVLRSDHFKDDVKKYVESSLKPIWLSMVFNGEASTSPRTFAESARIAMVPLGQKVWAIFVGSQNGTVDPFLDEIWTFSVIQFDSDKPILRAFGQKTQTDTVTWSNLGQQKVDENWADPEGMMQLYGVFDANLDGYKDFVFRRIGMGSGDEDSYRILVVSLTDKGFCEIVPEFALRDFYGLDGNKPLFQIGYFGEGQLYSTFHQEPLMLWRWNRGLMKVAEARGDGNFYIVSYKYHKYIENLMQEIRSKDITYVYLGHYELIGQTRHAQEAFLETIERYTQEQKDIVKVLLSKNHPMFVLKPEELLPELKGHNP